MNYRDIPLIFECENCRLVGIVARPQMPSISGVLIVVGGPQYRSGSHRQFTLLARDLAEHGTASLRFDYRGMGDSEGSRRNFTEVDADLRSAIDAFLAVAPSVRHVIIWGLCDAASAALYYAHTDSRVKGLVLLNPWVHSEAGAGRTRLKHYYFVRLLQGSFWLKLFSGQVRVDVSVAELFKTILRLFAKKENVSRAVSPMGNATHIDRMLVAMRLFSGDILLILSGKDLGLPGV